MRRALPFMTVATLGLMVWGSVAVAQSNPAPKPGGDEEKDLAVAEAAVDQTGSQPQGKQEVVNRLMSRFNVDAARIDALRAQNFGFGEIATILALSSKMTGGITDANVQSVLALRNGPPLMGWGQVAQKLGEKLGTVISDVNQVAKDARSAGGNEKAGASQKPDRPEHAQRPDRPEKPSRPDKPEPPSKP